MPSTATAFGKTMSEAALARKTAAPARLTRRPGERRAVLSTAQPA